MDLREKSCYVCIQHLLICFITMTESVDCAVRAESVNIVRVSLEIVKGNNLHLKYKERISTFLPVR
jgi:hypothetical protein